MPGNPPPDDGHVDAEDLDPELLRESGRASAIQDLAEQAQRMGDRAVALQRGTQSALNHQIRRWRRTTLGLALATVLLLVAMAYQISVSEDNKTILKDVELLVDFVEGLERNDEPDPQLQEVFTAVFEIREMMCATPPNQERIEACAELGGSPGN